MALFRVLSEDPLIKVEWSDTEERRNMCGLVYSFPNYFAFVYGMKQHTFRLKGSHKCMKIATRRGKEKEKLLFSGQHHSFCHYTLVWTDLYGLIIRIDINLNGSMHDRRLYNNSEPYRNPTEYFSEKEKLIVDTRFQGDGSHIVFPFKRNQCHGYVRRSHMNRDIRKQRIRNEWSV